MDDNQNKTVMEIPTLTFEPFDDANIPTAEVSLTVDVIHPLDKPSGKDLDETMLTEEEKHMIAQFSQQIDIRNSQMILQYGAAPQKKMTGFSESALSVVRSKDLGEIGDMLSGVVMELKGFNEEETKGFFGFFKKSANKLTAVKAKYDTAEANVNKICKVLDQHQVQLLKDIAMLDKMYDLNLVYYRELTMYILAGKQKLQQIEAEELPALREKARLSGKPEDAQAANDFESLCNRFDKKLHDLDLTRMISIQMAPQIRLIQNNDTVMSEKIQSTIVNTIPLWKSQMVLTLGIAHSTQAAQAQREVTNMTNELLRKNAATLKTASIETAKESERGIVDIETLRFTNETLIGTLDEVMQIQAEGREKRKTAEIELARIETDLKEKLLALRN